MKRIGLWGEEMQVANTLDVMLYLEMEAVGLMTSERVFIALSSADSNKIFF
jgi:hypothetical protein